jgi:hypothetical protein
VELSLEGRGLFPGFKHQQDCLKKHLENRMKRDEKEHNPY